MLVLPTPTEKPRMSNPIRLLAFAGSLRADSFNRKLIRVLATGASAAGAQVQVVELRELALPLYDGDLEATGTIPAGVRSLQEAFAAADGLLISTPEYNGSLSGVLKNTLDWISRPQANGQPGTNLFAGKPAGIVATSPGALGGLRALLDLRDALGKLGMWVAPAQVAVGGAATAFDASGELIDETRRAQVHAVAAQVVKAAAAFKTQA